MTGRGYSAIMRMALVAVVLAMVGAGGCAADNKKAIHEEQISAARLSGKFRHDDPLVAMLSPTERAALDRAGMMQAKPAPEFDADGNEIVVAGDETGDETGDDTDAEKSTADKAGDVMLAMLSVIVPIGMAVAPYLLF